MSVLSLEDSLIKANQHLENLPRRSRSDRGASRLDEQVEAELVRLLSGKQRPDMTKVAAALRDYATARGLRPASRATLYNALQRIPLAVCDWQALPAEVRQSLYNWRADSAPTTQDGPQVSGAMLCSKPSPAADARG